MFGMQSPCGRRTHNVARKTTPNWDMEDYAELSDIIRIIYHIHFVIYKYFRF